MTRAAPLVHGAHVVILIHARLLRVAANVRNGAPATEGVGEDKLRRTDIGSSRATPTATEMPASSSR
jgi:hypothetical protein